MKKKIWWSIPLSFINIRIFYWVFISKFGMDCKTIKCYYFGVFVCVFEHFSLRS